MPNFYQEEIVKDLAASNVKFILYQNNYWSNRIDKFNIKNRLPLVMNYIKNNYSFHKKINQNILWTKNSPYTGL